MGYRTHRDIVGESFSATTGAVTPVLRPFPDLGGRLRAGYLFGSAYARFAPEAIGRQLGPRYDWSGRGQHIERFGRWTVSDYWLVCQVSSIMPRTPFNADALISDPAQGVTLIAFCYSDATAKAVSLIRSLGAANGSNTDLTTSDPYISLALQPQTSSGRVVALHNNSGSVQGALNPLPDELGEVAMYAGVFKNSGRTPYARGPGASIKTGSTESTSKTLTSTGRFIMGAETGSGAGSNRLLGCAFYRDLDTTQLLDTVYDRFAVYHSAISSGLSL